VACALVAAPAWGLDFQAGAALKGGGASLSLAEGSGVASPPMGWGAGFNAFGGIKFTPMLPVSLGVNFDYMHFWHEDTTTNRRTNGSLPSVGLYLRYGGVDTTVPNAPPTGFGFGGWANYVFGSVTALTPSAADPTFVRPEELSLGGWQFGAQAFYQYRLGRYKTFIEAGAFLTYNSLASQIEQPGQTAGETLIRKFDASYFTFGVFLQTTFEFGRGR
jgi:hypothetical protein